MVMECIYNLKQDRRGVGESFGWLIPQNVVELPDRETCQELCSTELGTCRVTGLPCVIFPVIAVRIIES